MSALAMILTAAMAIPGEGPDKVSGEMERGLDLSGQWEGTARCELGEAPVSMIDGKFCTISDGSITLYDERVIDEGRGRLRVRMGSCDCLGIYHQERNRIRIFLQPVPEGYPVSFKITKDNQSLIMLHRDKSRKYLRATPTPAQKPD